MNQKHYTKKSALLLSACALFFLCNCHNSDEIATDTHAFEDVTEGDAQAFDAPSNYRAETVIEAVPEVAPTPAPVAEPTLAASMAPVAPELVPPDPLLFYQDPFAGELQVAPWHANYVGSYGLLPTRYQDKGPSLYSFDVSPENAALEDNNLGPLEFFDYGGDDDDDH